VTRSLPPRDDLVRLIQASMFNARDLLADARVLLDGGSAPRAHALATLALEEVGKANLCILVVMPPGLLSVDGFWDSWRSHTDKLLWARGLLDVIIREPAGALQQILSRLEDASRSDHVRKMRGLYVDYDRGEVLVPGAIGDEEARQLMDDVQATLDLLMRSWGDQGIFERIKLLDSHADELTAMLDRIMQSVAVDPGAALGQFRELFRSEFADTEPD
jgi:AbiV family abortive infection protein